MLGKLNTLALLCLSCSFYFGVLPIGELRSQHQSVLIDVGIAGDNHVYYWFDYSTERTIGKVCSGTTDNPEKYRTLRPFEFSPNKKIIGIAIAGFNDRVYYWYDDGTVSAGTSTNPTRYRNYYASNLRKTLIGVAIAMGQNGHVYYWYSDGTVSSGTTGNPTKYRNYYASNLDKSLIGVGIAADDHTYYWYRDGTVSAGTTNNPTRYRNYYQSNLIR